MESGVKTTRRWCSFHDLLIETTIFCQDEGRYKGVVGSASNQLHSILFSKLFRRSLSLSIIEYLCQDEGRYKGVVGSASNQWFTHRIHHIFYLLIWNRIVTLASSWPVSAGHRSSVIGHRSIAEMLPGHCWPWWFYCFIVLASPHMHCHLCCFHQFFSSWSCKWWGKTWMIFLSLKYKIFVDIHFDS
jgi:hypothetical protein